MKSLRVNGRLSFVVLLVSQLAATMGFTFVLPFMPIYVQALGVADAGHAAAWAGVINSSTAVTMALAIYTDPFGIGGLPALPLLCLAFLGGNADLIWRRLRAERREPDPEPR